VCSGRRVEEVCKEFRVEEGEAAREVRLGVRTIRKKEAEREASAGKRESSPSVDDETVQCSGLA
jgi:hypothetical protein